MGGTREGLDDAVDVIMPVYDNERYLEQAIKSVLGQTIENLTLIVVSECGTSEESVRIVDGFKDRRLKHIKNQTRLGLAESLNVGLRVSKVAIVARMDSDDISRSDRL